MTILEKLVQLSKDDELITDADFEHRGVAWLVPVTKDGRLLPFRPTKTEPEFAEGKRARAVAKSFRIPRQAKRSGTKAPAYFLVDNAKYVFGLPTEDKPFTAEEGQEKASLFRAQIEACADSTGDEAVRAIWRALDDIASGRASVTLPADCKSNDYFAFVFEPDIDQLVHERPAVRRYWEQLRATESGTDVASFQCAVTGQPTGSPLSFPNVKGVPGATSSGAPLVSFNRPAFESYGLSSNENAPISRAAAEAAATALERLIHRSPEYGGRRNIRIGDSTVVAFWASDRRASRFLDMFANILEVSDPSEVSDLYRSIWRGQPAPVEDPGRFYALTLSGAQGRLIVRDWFEASVAEVSRHLAQHFADLSVVRNTPRPKSGDLSPQVPLRALLGSLAPFGNQKDIPAPLVSDLVDSALRGTPYPLSLLQRALERARAEVGISAEPDKRWRELERRDARAALIKAVLERRRRLGLSTTHPELTPAMDPTNLSQGYLLGRLIAVLERLQQLSLGDVNASVIDRYFSAASATPKAVFPRLLRSARHHARKAKDDPAKKGTAWWLDRMIDDIASGLVEGKSVRQAYGGIAFDARDNAFPAYLPLDQQGLFVLGYHHQRHTLWAKRPDNAPAADRDDDPKEIAPSA